MDYVSVYCSDHHFVITGAIMGVRSERIWSGCILENVISCFERS